MGTVVTFVTHVGITTGDSVATASQSPAAGELWCVDVQMRDTGITPSVSGTGLTWAQEAQVNGQQSGPQLRLWRFRGLSTSTPSSGAITVTVTGNTKPVTVQVWKATGVDTSAPNGSGAFAQTVTDPGPAVDDANMTKGLTTLNNNAVVVGFGGSRTKTYTLQSGETTVDLNYAQGTGGDIATGSIFYKSAATAGTVVTLGATGSLSGAIDWAMIVSELKEANTAISGAGSVTLAALTGSAAGAVAIVGQGGVTLAALTGSGAGQLAIVGQGGVTLDALTSSGAGALAIVGQGGVTLAALTGSGVSQIARAGQGGVTLAALTGSGAGQLAIVGQGSVTLAALTSSGVIVALAVAFGIMRGGGTGGTVLGGRPAGAVGGAGYRGKVGG